MGISTEHHLAIRSPDHLGDGVMALPALQALADQFELHIIGPRWIKELYFSITSHFYVPNPAPICASIVLFKPSFGSAWRARHYQQRFGIANGLRRHLLTDSCSNDGHRIDQFNRIARLLDVTPDHIPLFQGDSVDTPALPAQFILMIVGTNSANTVQWKGFNELAGKIEKPVVFLGGPGDEISLNTLGKGYLCLPVSLSLSQVAAISQQASVVIGLDSGLTHLAVAARNATGISAARNIIIYGSTSPEDTGPRNSTSQYNLRPVCWPCYQKSCAINVPCLDTSVDDILGVLS